MYEYRCQVFNIVDGDTVDCVIDLGRRIHITERVRLWGINVADKKDQNALSAKAFVQLLLIGKPLVIRTLLDKDDKYGRLLGVFHEANETCSVNQKVLDQGYATPFMTKLTSAGNLPQIKDGKPVMV